MNGNLPAWTQRLLGIEPRPGEGVSWSLVHSWPWPPWLTLLVVILAGTYVVAVYLREGRQASRRRKLLLAGLRLAVAALLLAAIAQVGLSFQRTGLPCLALVLDDSQSMGIVDQYDETARAAIEPRLKSAGYQEPSRWNLARTLLTEGQGSLLRALSQEQNLRVYYLTGLRSSEAESVPAMLEELQAREPLGPSTRLGAGLRSVLDELRGTPPAAIVLLTDGINTEGPPLAEGALAARRRGVPLLVVALGDERPVRDLRLSDLLVDDLVFAGDVVNFEAQLTGTGFAGRTVEVVLREEGKSEPLARVEAVVGPDGVARTVRVPYQPTEVGEFSYVLEVRPLEGESQTDNNRLARQIQVRKEKIRVLLAQGGPSYEFRYLRNLLARDETVELASVLQEADLEHTRQDRAALRFFPVRREELLAYDVVILGDVNPALLSEAALEHLSEFVLRKSKGGALVLVAGPRWMPAAYRGTPLAALMPVDPGTARAVESGARGFVFQPTELGLASPAMQLGDTPAETEAIWKGLPPLYWMVEAPDLKPAARVLAEHPSRTGPDGRRLPLVAMQYVGAGRVLMHLTDETWRWRWRVGDAYFARYWIQTIRWLARGKLAGEGDLELSAERRQYRPGETVRLRVRFPDQRQAPAEDDGVTVVLEHAGHPAQRIKLRRVADSRGLFETLLTVSGAGTYHGWVAIPAVEGRAPAADFTVVAPPGELAETRMAAAELRRAADETKGRYYTFATAPRLAEELPEGRPVPVESLPPKPLWTTWPALLLLLALLTAEWILRKRSGMV